MIQRLEAASSTAVGRMVASSEAMKKVVRLVLGLAPLEIHVMLQGETGVGKEVVATAIHECSERGDGPLVTLNCAAMPPQLLESELFGYKAGAFTGAERDRQGKLRYASEGTLFLDEVNSMPLEVQAKLLRVLECGRVCPLGSNDEVEIDLRIISACNESLEDLVAEGRFRADLRYRLENYALLIPPLRERSEEIPELVDYLLQRESHRLGGVRSVSERAMTVLRHYRWPGNVRELRNVLIQASVNVGVRAGGAGTIELEDLPVGVFAVDDESGRCVDLGNPGPSAEGATFIPPDVSYQEVLRRVLTARRGLCDNEPNRLAESLQISRQRLGRLSSLAGL